MKQKEELLFKDLCARLPYGVKLRYVEDLVVKKESHTITLNNIYLEHIINGDADIKPYLRPLSNMTDEERKEYKHLVAFSGNSYGAADLVDWLNKKMFAYRAINGKDMFELGLALEAPEGMYNI